jgi:hypothetical protein
LRLPALIGRNMDVERIKKSKKQTFSAREGKTRAPRPP